MTSAEEPEDRTPGYRRTSASASGDEGLDGGLDDATALSRRRQAADVDVDVDVDEVTKLSIRRSSAVAETDDSADEVTTISTRRQAGESVPEGDDAVDDATAPSSRAGAALRSADHATADDLPDTTALARRRAPSSAETVRELEDTILRPAVSSPSAAPPAAPNGSSATGSDRPSRDAVVPDAAALRVPVPPRAIPPVVASRAAQQPPLSGQARHPEAPDHENAERSLRVRDRRRVLVVVLSATAVALVSAIALVLLLT